MQFVVLPRAALRASAVAFLVAACTEPAPPKPAKLALATAPSANPRSGVVFETQPSIQLQTAEGKPVGVAGINVGVSIGGAGTLTGATSAVTTADGIAKFTDLAVGGVTGEYTLTFSAPDLESVTATVTLAAGAAAKLTLTTSPSASARSRVAFETQPVLQLRDAFDNPVPQAAVRVGAAITTGGGTLMGGGEVETSADGSATFTNLAIGGTIGSRKLTFSALGVPANASADVNLTAGLPASVTVVAGANQGALVGSAVDVAPSVKVTDADANPVAGVAVTFAVASGGGSVSGASRTTDASGVATMERWTLGAEGANTLTVSAGGASTTVTATAAAIVPVVAHMGGMHACALTSAGEAYCWGNNDHGQLGDGTTTSSSTPVRVYGTLTFVAIDVGLWHTIALAADGRLYAWGSTLQGQLGTGSFSGDRNTPEAVATSVRFTQVSAGAYHNVALSTDGVAYAWGLNDRGRLGNNNLTWLSMPTAIVGNLRFKAVAAGGSHSLGLTVAGPAYAWGDNTYGQLGNGSASGFERDPVPVRDGITFAAISAGNRHSLALTSAGKAYGWGYNGGGALGVGITGDPTYIVAPTVIAPELTFKSISAGGESSTIAVVASGAAFAWGKNDGGRLGLGYRGLCSDPKGPCPNDETGALGIVKGPRAVAGGLTFRRVQTGELGGMGITASGVVYRWGSGYYTEYTSVGYTSDRYEPTLLPSALTWR